jgi:hypothetical protein
LTVISQALLIQCVERHHFFSADHINPEQPFSSFPHIFIPMSPELPPEVLRSVVEPIGDWKTLLTLLTTSRAFQEEAERVLYATFQPHCRGELFKAVHVAWITRIASSTRIASYAKFVDITCPIVAKVEYEKPFWSAFAMALPHMSNLQDLGTSILLSSLYPRASSCVI